MGNTLVLTPADSANYDLKEELGRHLQDFSVEGSLAQGKFLSTFACRSPDGTEAVVKVYRLPSGERNVESPTEADHAVDLFRHRLEEIARAVPCGLYPHVLPYQRFIAKDKSPLVMAVRQRLFHTLRDRVMVRPFFTGVERAWTAYQILSALAQLHGGGVCHGDLKLDNLLVTSWGWVMVTDMLPKPPLLPANLDTEFSYFFAGSGQPGCYVAPERFVDDMGVAATDPADGLSRPPRRSSAAGSTADGSGASSGGTPTPAHSDRVGRRSAAAAGRAASQRQAFDWSLLTQAGDVFAAGCCIAELWRDGGAPLFDLPTILALRAGRTTAGKLVGSIPDRPYWLQPGCDAAGASGGGPGAPAAAEDGLAGVVGGSVRALVAHMTQLTPGNRAPAAAYRAACTGPGRLFPPFFHSLVEPLMAAFVADPRLGTPDARARALLAAYPTLVRDMTGEADEAGERLIGLRLALEEAALGDEDLSAAVEAGKEGRSALRASLGSLAGWLPGVADSPDRPWWHLDHLALGSCAFSNGNWVQFGLPAWGEAVPARESAAGTSGAATSPPRARAASDASSAVAAEEQEGGAEDLVEQAYREATTALERIRDAIREVDGAGAAADDDSGDSDGDELAAAATATEAATEAAATEARAAAGLVGGAATPWADGSALVLPIVALTSVIRHVSSPRLRLSCVMCLARLATHPGVSDEIRLQRVLPYIVSLLPDHARRVRSGALLALTSVLDCVSALPLSESQLFPQYILPAVTRMPNDADLGVQVAFARCLPLLGAAVRRLLESAQSELQMVAALRGRRGVDGATPGADSAGVQSLASPGGAVAARAAGGAVVGGSGGTTPAAAGREASFDESSPMPGATGPVRAQMDKDLAQLRSQIWQLLRRWIIAVGQGNAATGVIQRVVDRLPATSAAVRPMGKLLQADGGLRDALQALNKMPAAATTAIIRRALMAALPPLLSSVGPDEVLGDITGMFINLVEDGEWRLIDAVFRRVSPVLASLGPARSEKVVLPFLTQGLAAPAEPASRTAFAALADALQQRLLLRPELSLADQKKTIVAGTRHPSAWVRLPALRLVAVTCSRLPIEDAWADWRPLLLQNAAAATGPEPTGGGLSPARAEAAFWTTAMAAAAAAGSTDPIEAAKEPELLTAATEALALWQGAPVSWGAAALASRDALKAQTTSSSPVHPAPSPALSRAASEASSRSSQREEGAVLQEMEAAKANWLMSPRPVGLLLARRTMDLGKAKARSSAPALAQEDGLLRADQALPYSRDALEAIPVRTLRFPSQHCADVHPAAAAAATPHSGGVVLVHSGGRQAASFGASSAASSGPGRLPVDQLYKQAGGLPLRQFRRVFGAAFRQGHPGSAGATSAAAAQQPPQAVGGSSGHAAGDWADAVLQERLDAGRRARRLSLMHGIPSWRSAGLLAAGGVAAGDVVGGNEAAADRTAASRGRPADGTAASWMGDDAMSTDSSLLPVVAGGVAVDEAGAAIVTGSAATLSAFIQPLGAASEHPAERGGGGGRARAGAGGGPAHRLSSFRGPDRRSAFPRCILPGLEGFDYQRRVHQAANMAVQDIAGEGGQPVRQLPNADMEDGPGSNALVLTRPRDANVAFMLASTITLSPSSADIAGAQSGVGIVRAANTGVNVYLPLRKALHAACVGSHRGAALAQALRRDLGGSAGGKLHLDFCEPAAMGSVTRRLRALDVPPLPLTLGHLKRPRAQKQQGGSFGGLPVLASAFEAFAASRAQPAAAAAAPEVPRAELLARLVSDATDHASGRYAMFVARERVPSVPRPLRDQGRRYLYRCDVVRSLKLVPLHHDQDRGDALRGPLVGATPPLGPPNRVGDGSGYAGRGSLSFTGIQSGAAAMGAGFSPLTHSGSIAGTGAKLAYGRTHQGGLADARGDGGASGEFADPAAPWVLESEAEPLWPSSQQSRSSRKEEQRPWGSRPRGLLLSSWNGHDGMAILGLAVCQDYSFFATAGVDGSVRVWNTKKLRDMVTPRPVLTYRPPPDVPGGELVGSVRCVSILPDTTTMAVGMASGQVHLVRVALQQQHRLDGATPLPAGDTPGVDAAASQGGFETGSFQTSFSLDMEPRPMQRPAWLARALHRAGDKLEQSPWSAWAPASAANNAAPQRPGEHASATVVAVLSLDPQAGPVRSIAAYDTRDKRMVLVAGAGSVPTVSAWDIRARRLEFTARFPPALGGITAMALGPRAARSQAGGAASGGAACVVVGTDRGFVAVWDLRFRATVACWRVPAGPAISSLQPYLTRSIRPLDVPSTKVLGSIDLANERWQPVEQLGCAISWGTNPAAAHRTASAPGYRVGYFNLETGICLRLLVSEECADGKVAADAASGDPFRSYHLERAAVIAERLGQFKHGSGSQAGAADGRADDEQLRDNATARAMRSSRESSGLAATLPGADGAWALHVAAPLLRPVMTSRMALPTAGGAQAGAADGGDDDGSDGEAEGLGEVAMGGSGHSGARQVFIPGGTVGAGAQRAAVRSVPPRLAESASLHLRNLLQRRGRDASGAAGDAGDIIELSWSEVALAVDRVLDLHSLPVWMLSAGPDRAVRCWHLCDPQSSFTVAGLRPGCMRKPYRWANPEDSPGTMPARHRAERRRRGDGGAAGDGDDPLLQPPVGEEVHMAGSQLLRAPNPAVQAAPTGEIVPAVELRDERLPALPEVEMQGPMPACTRPRGEVTCMEWLDSQLRLLITCDLAGDIRIWR